MLAWQFPRVGSPTDHPAIGHWAALLIVRGQPGRYRDRALAFRLGPGRPRPVSRERRFGDAWGLASVCLRPDARRNQASVARGRTNRRRHAESLGPADA